MGDDRVDLSGANVFVSQQFADRLYGDTLRQRDRSGERMAGRMERDAFVDARRRCDPAQTSVAPSVARQTENREIGRFGQIVLQNRMRQGEQPDAHFGAGLAAGQIEPPGAGGGLLYLAPGEVAEVDVGQSRETTEQKRIAHALQRPGREIDSDQFVDFIDCQIIAVDEFAAQLVTGEHVVFEVPLAAGQHEDVFQRDHVDPRRILLAAAPLDDVGMEAGEEFVVEFVECDIGSPVGRFDVALQMPADAPIFIISSPAPADADHAAEFVVVPAEKLQKPAATLRGSEISLLDHDRSDERPGQKERAVTLLNAVTDVQKLAVDFAGGSSASRHLPGRRAPVALIYR